MMMIMVNRMMIMMHMMMMISIRILILNIIWNPDGWLSGLVPVLLHLLYVYPPLHLSCSTIVIIIIIRIKNALWCSISLYIPPIIIILIAACARKTVRCYIVVRQQEVA